MYIKVEILPIGVYVEVDGKSYVISSSETYQEPRPNQEKRCGLPKADIITKYRLLPINGEGEETGEEPIWVGDDEKDIAII